MSSSAQVPPTGQAEPVPVPSASTLSVPPWIKPKAQRGKRVTKTDLAESMRIDESAYNLLLVNTHPVHIVMREFINEI